ncbi:uridine kinase [Catenuloplanes nepalensis]|uniref:Uridine kinase n=1 Tax=Catenuloplanes nepalensis TaxID=587533 RepID=A0ABT9N2U4_9ACTN|nr:ATP-binding protein [Catenuloplanes nepalensis]MDP9797838.1 uridine kinase [Catenuloplanes nepalensis]
MTNSPARVVLLAGPSGSGKSYIARRAGFPVLCLDDFYKDGDDPTLPRTAEGTDWESPQAWDSAMAVETIARLAETGRAEVPVYAIGVDQRIATRLFDLAGSPIFIAEGIFAAEIVRELRDRGLLAEAYALRRSRTVTFARRLGRDLTERRKPPALLVRRGLQLLRAEPVVLRRQVALGCRAAGAGRIVREVRAMADVPDAAGTHGEPAVN